LPGKYSQFVWAGAGKYIGFHMEADQKVLVYNLEQEFPKQAFEIAGIPAGDLLTASAQKLAIVSPNSMTIRRWDLKSGEQEELTAIKGNDPPKVAAMGFAGNGPLLLVGRKSAGFFDLKTLKPIVFKGKMIAGTDDYGLSVQVSPDGQAFGTIPVGLGPVAYGAWHIDKNELVVASFGGTSNAVRWAQPSGDGYLMMLPDGEVFTGHGRPFKADWLKGSNLIPTPDPGLVLDLRLDQKQRKGTLTVCSTADCKAIDSETGFEELIPSETADVRTALKLGSEWRIQYVPALKQIFSLPQSNDRIVQRPYDMEVKLRRERKKYLYLASTPPLSIAAGQRLFYPIKVETSAGTFQTSLEDRPRNTQLSGNTNLRWTAPLNPTSPWVRFSLTIRDGQDQVLVHSFEVAIRPPDAK
jgi:hypothetical protein